MNNNILLQIDSYKDSHNRYYPPNTTGLFSYIESRGGAYEDTGLVFFGLQGFIQEYLNKPITMEDIDEKVAHGKLHGVEVPEAGLRRIVEKHGGYFPVRIKAVKEGAIVPLHNAVVTVENIDPELPWVTSYIETMLLRAVWYPCTIASKANYIRKHLNSVWGKYAETGLSPEFAFHDFSARGCSSNETNAIGGAAFLTSFKGSDSTAGIIWARDNYGEPMAGYNVSATEHSIMTSYGRDNEAESFWHLIDITPHGGIISVVSDTWDIYKACHRWGGLVDFIKKKNITLVIRPDSGEPNKVLPKMIEILDNYFSYRRNDKGFFVFDNLKILWGDGVNEKTFLTIVEQFVHSTNFGPENLIMGSGGGLLQNVTRDDMKFAMKASAVQIGGKEWKPIFKDPVTDSGKKSKKGRLMLIRSKTDDAIQTVDESLAEQLGTPLLEVVWECGSQLRYQSFDHVRSLIEKGF